MSLKIDIIDEVILNAKLKDLNPIYFGYIKYLKGYIEGVNERNLTRVQYIESGSGIFYLKNKRYEMGAGDVFIAPQGVQTSFEITEDTRVIHIGFDGELSNAFRSLEPVFKSPPDIFNEILSRAECKGRVDVLVSSILMKWYFQLFPGEAPQTDEYDYVTRTKEYIKENYMHPLKVDDIAKAMNINRTYLSRIFKKKTGKTVGEYLTSVRLKEAKLLLNDGKNVTEAALLCGFSSQSYFSKVFKRFYSYSPKSHKKAENKSGKNDI